MLVSLKLATLENVSRTIDAIRPDCLPVEITSKSRDIKVAYINNTHDIMEAKRFLKGETFKDGCVRLWNTETGESNLNNHIIQARKRRQYYARKYH